MLATIASAQGYSAYEKFFEGQGGRTVAKYAHPKENYASSRVLDVTSEHVEIEVTFNWTTSRYILYKESDEEGIPFFTGIVTTLEGSYVPSFARCNTPSLSNLPDEFVSAYCQIIGESRSDLDKMQRICAIITFQFLKSLL